MVTPVSPNPSIESVNESRQIRQETLGTLFERFWSECARKTQKKEARANFETALQETDFDTLLAAIKAHADEVRGKDQKRIKEPATLLYERFWLGKGGARQQRGPEPAARPVEKAPRLEVTAPAEEQARFANVMQILSDEFEPAIYENWLSDLALVAGDAASWTIAAPSKFKRDWVAPRYGDSIRRASGRKIEIVVGAAAVGNKCQANGNTK